MCLLKLVKESSVICFLGNARTFVASSLGVNDTVRWGLSRGPLARVTSAAASPGTGLADAAAGANGNCDLVPEVLASRPVVVGEGVREARASAAAMPEGAGAGVVSSTALSAGGLAIGLAAGTNRACDGWVNSAVLVVVSAATVVVGGPG